MIVTIICLCAGVFCVGFGYWWGHNDCWLKWEDWTKDERMSQKTRNRIAGIE